MAGEVAGTAARAEALILEHAAAAGTNNGTVKIDQHGPLGAMRSVACGASCICAADVNSMVAEALVPEDAPFHVMTLVAQCVIGERVGDASRRSSRR